MSLRLHSLILFALVLALAGCGGGEASDTARSADDDARDAVRADLDAFADEIAQALLNDDGETLRARYVPLDQIDGCQKGMEQFDDLKPMQRRYDDDRLRFETFTTTTITEADHEQVLIQDTNMWSADGTLAIKALEGDTCPVDYHGETWVTLVRANQPPHLDEYRMYLIHLNDQWYHYDAPGESDFDCDEMNNEDCQLYEERAS
jgi:hypothetical protein